jgi:hypothetical protein
MFQTMLQTMGQWAVNGVLAGFAVVLVRDICLSFSPKAQGEIFNMRVWLTGGFWGCILGAALGSLWSIST